MTDDRQPDRSRHVSWPVLAALGLPLAEAGIIFGLFPVAVGGLFLFCGSLVGLLRNAGLVDDVRRALVGTGLVLLLGGPVLAFTRVNDLTAVDLLARGSAIAVAGGLLVAAGLALPMLLARR